jgi:hypothetical protein
MLALLEFNDRIGCIGLIGYSTVKLVRIAAGADSIDAMQAGFVAVFRPFLRRLTCCRQREAAL